MFNSNLTPVVLLLIAFPIAAWLCSPIVAEVHWWWVKRGIRRQIERNSQAFERQRAERMREVVGER